jgi:hypothetical protein
MLLSVLTAARACWVHGLLRWSNLHHCCQSAHPLLLEPMGQVLWLALLRLQSHAHGMSEGLQAEELGAGS